MISSLDILHILSIQDNYDRFSPHIKEHLVGKEAWIIIQDMKEWYEKHTEIDWDKFAEYFLVIKHSIYKPEKAELFKTIFEKLKKHDPDEDLKEDLINHFISKDYATKIAETSLAIIEGSAEYELDDINILMDEYDIEVDRSADIDAFIIEDDLENAFKDDRSTTGLKWRLPELNEAISPINKSDFIVVASYSGTGKTTLLASEVTHMASQLPEDRYVLWFNNEEAGKSVQERIWCAATNMTEDECKAYPLKFQESYKDSGAYGKIKMIDEPGMFIHDFKRFIKRFPPGLIVIDQLYKVHGFSKESGNEVTRIGMLYNWGRELAKTYCPVIVTHQADGTAIGQQWIEMNQLHMSKVALQGEMDVILTLGRSLEPGMEKIRGLYTPKNKITGKEDFKAEVVIDNERARFYSPF